MDKTDKFNHFLKNIGDLYNKTDQKEKAIKAYKAYLKIYPGDVATWEKLATITDEKEIAAKAKKLR